MFILLSLFPFSCCFRCISYAFLLLASPLQVASQWRKKAAPCWHFTIHAKRNWQRVIHYPACPQCCIPLASNNLQRKSLTFIIQILYRHIYISYDGIYMKSGAAEPKAFATQWMRALNDGLHLNWHLIRQKFKSIDKARLCTGNSY